MACLRDGSFYILFNEVVGGIECLLCQVTLTCKIEGLNFVGYISSH